MSLTDVWPDWGSQGEQPEDGSEYDPGDNVKARTLNHLWYQLRETFSDIETEITSVEGDLDDHVTDTQNIHGVGENDVASTADVSSIQQSADVDHNQTSNRTHDGDDLSPDSIDVESAGVEQLIELPVATEGDEAPSDRAVAIDPEEGELLVAEEV